MKVVYTEAHLGHNPQEEIAESGSHSPHEHTARAENIREVLQADKSMQLLSPTQWGVEQLSQYRVGRLSARSSTKQGSSARLFLSPVHA